MKTLFKKLLDGVVMGIGFLIFSVIIALISFYFFVDFNTKQSIIAKLQRKGLIEEVIKAPDQQSTEVKRLYIQPPLETPAEFTELWVADEQEFLKAMKKANEEGQVAIILESGSYHISSTIYVTAENIMVKSATGNPYDVVLFGNGMNKTGPVEGIFRINASFFTLDGVTLSDVPNHLVQVAGELNASYPYFRNVIFQNSYEQLLKVSYNYKSQSSQDKKSIGGVVEGCIFQYTQGIGPNFYIGGVDALGAEDWVIKNSVFRDIASPRGRIAQYAVHFWDNSDRNQVINNIFIDNDRAIGFGMQLPERGIRYAHREGLAKGNIIYHTDNGDPFADVGIMAEGNQGLIISDNVIFQLHEYDNAIEYRWSSTRDALVTNNKTNKPIKSRDGAAAILSANQQNLTLEEFIESLHSKSKLLKIIDFKAPIKEQEN